MGLQDCSGETCALTEDQQLRRQQGVPSATRHEHGRESLPHFRRPCKQWGRGGGGGGVPAVLTDSRPFYENPEVYPRPLNARATETRPASPYPITIIIAFKGAIRDFLQSPHSAANCLQHVRSSGPGAIMCKSPATHRALITCKCHVTCHLVRRDSSAVKFDRIEIAFI